MDITIKKIVNAYYIETSKWQRAFFAPRVTDGIVLFTEGKIKYDFGNKTLVAQKGDILLLPGNIPYSGEKKSKNVAFFVLDFECVSENEFNKTFGASVYSEFDSNILHLKFSKAVVSWKKQLLGASLELKSFAYYVLSNIINSRARMHEGTAHTEAMLEFICQNVKDQNLVLSDLCSKFSISESQLRRNIYKYTGMNPNQYIQKMRLDMAKAELINTQKSIKSISEDCGFSSPYYFSKCFFKKYGLSPKAYRAKFTYT
jgi:AraC-like DNA-binding protein